MKIIDSIAHFSGLAAAGVLVLMMLLTVADVSLRATLSKPIIGTTEITEQMMVAVVFLGFGYCALKGRQIKVDLFVSRYRPKMQRGIDFMIYSVGLILVAVICWRTFLTTLTVQRLGITCSYIGMPKFPFYGLATFGWMILLIAIVRLLVKTIKGGILK